MGFDYERLVQDSLLKVVQKVLTKIEKDGLPGKHHFYITFLTTFPGVLIPPYLKDQYPDEMTIVIQYEYYDLSVKENEFLITLSFNNVHERLTIPFASLVGFVDPSVKFGLQFTPDVALAPLEPDPPPTLSGGNVISFKQFKEKK